MGKSEKPAHSAVIHRCYLPATKVAKYRVHPLAARYPLMPDEKLDAMAADIAKPHDGKTTGQLHPVVLRQVGKSREVIDGRNRIEACRRAGVPVYVIIIDLSDSQVANKIASLNDLRRQQSHREQAEAAWAYLAEINKGPGPKLTNEELAKLFGIGVRTLYKWRPGGNEAKASDAKKGNNNNCFPISPHFRHHAYLLSKLGNLFRPKNVSRQEIEWLFTEIKRLAKLEFDGRPD